MSELLELRARLATMEVERDVARADALAAVQRKIELVKERDRLAAALADVGLSAFVDEALKPILTDLVAAALQASTEAERARWHAAVARFAEFVALMIQDDAMAVPGCDAPTRRRGARHVAEPSRDPDDPGDAMAQRYEWRAYPLLTVPLAATPGGERAPESDGPSLAGPSLRDPERGPRPAHVPARAPDGFARLGLDDPAIPRVVPAEAEDTGSVGC